MDYVFSGDNQHSSRISSRLGSLLVTVNKAKGAAVGFVESNSSKSHYLTESSQVIAEYHSQKNGGSNQEAATLCRRRIQWVRGLIDAFWGYPACQDAQSKIILQVCQVEIIVYKEQGGRYAVFNRSGAWVTWKWLTVKFDNLFSERMK